jgi:hypothetical protein
VVGEPSLDPEGESDPWAAVSSPGAVFLTEGVKGLAVEVEEVREWMAVGTWAKTGFEVEVEEV